MDGASGEFLVSVLRSGHAMEGGFGCWLLVAGGERGREGCASGHGMVGGRSEGGLVGGGVFAGRSFLGLVRARGALRAERASEI